MKNEYPVTAAYPTDTQSIAQEVFCPVAVKSPERKYRARKPSNMNAEPNKVNKKNFNEA